MKLNIHVKSQADQGLMQQQQCPFVCSKWMLQVKMAAKTNFEKL